MAPDLISQRHVKTGGTTVLFSIVGVLYAIASAYVCYSILILECRLSWMAAQTIAIFLAGAIYLWYTYETKLLRKYAKAQHDRALDQIEITRRQFDVSTRPLVLALKTTLADTLVLRNDGGSTAINIDVKGRVDTGDTGKMVLIEFPDRETALAAGADASMRARQLTEGKPEERTFLLAPGAATWPVHIEIHYEDIARRKYVTHVTTSNERYEIVRFTFPDDND